MIRCIIVDDESPAIELVKNHVNTIGGIEIVACCHSAIEAYDILKKEKIDLMFLDIEMPVLKGLDFLKSLHTPPKAIVTTAYRDYAIDGYDLDIVDYLLKPISFGRFVKAIDRYYERSESTQNIVPIDNTEKYFYVNLNKKNIKILYHDILYIESLKDYVKIHMTEQQLTIKSNIGKIESLLPSTEFLRVHRSFIISLDKITAFTQRDIEIGQTEIPIGISYTKSVHKVIGISK